MLLHRERDGRRKWERKRERRKKDKCQCIMHLLHKGRVASQTFSIHSLHIFIYIYTKNNSPRRSQAQSTNQTSTQVTCDITVQVRHHHHIEAVRVLCHVEHSIVNGHLLILDIWVGLGSLTTAVQKQAIHQLITVALCTAVTFLRPLSLAYLKAN